MAENLLHSLKLSYSDIELLAATTGPGSFTGVRIGAALVKGIAFGKNIPCVSVSTLEALAENAKGLCGIIVPAMDARREQVYTAIFSSDGEQLERLTADMAISTTELASMLKAHDGERIYLVGDGYATAKRALTQNGVKTQNTPTLLITENAYSCAMVAQRKYERGEYTDDKKLSPTYLRLPQAERERIERENTK
jgi:tRNA threonylcarbamoyladenosine biosynthesis protein TsaB